MYLDKICQQRFPPKMSFPTTVEPSTYMHFVVFFGRTVNKDGRSDSESLIQLVLTIINCTNLLPSLLMSWSVNKDGRPGLWFIDWLDLFHLILSMARLVSLWYTIKIKMSEIFLIFVNNRVITIGQRKRTGSWRNVWTSPGLILHLTTWSC